MEFNSAFKELNRASQVPCGHIQQTRRVTSMADTGIDAVK
jgi:hypothetical protein